MKEKSRKIMNIKEVEKITGLTRANIRFYEDEGLVKPERNAQNNYRIYTEVEIERLQEIKKLRLLGISIPDIQKIYKEELQLEKAMEHRLQEIREEEKLLKETRSICQKAIRDHWEMKEINQLEIMETKEEWQERLRKLMSEDLTETKLTEKELNHMITLIFSAGTLLSLLVIRLLNVTWLEKYFYAGVLALIAEFGVLLVSTMSANVKTHFGLTVAGAIVHPIGLIMIVGAVCGIDTISTQSKMHAVYRAMEYHYVFWLYIVVLLAVLVVWMLSKVWENVLKSFVTTLLASLVCVAGLMLPMYMRYGEVMSTWNLGVFIVCAFLQAITVFGTWKNANSDWKAYNRYHGVYTAGRMINVFATIISAIGFNSENNWRR